MREQRRWIIVAAYTVAMAWVEAAVVFYLRTLSYRIQPYQADPLPQVTGLEGVELIREAATLIMLLTVGLLAGRDARSRWGYAAIAFGVWDIFYYVFLRVVTGWPATLKDWDVLFLIPLPWWGPVIAPMLISLLMIAWGTLATQWEHGERRFRMEWKAWLANGIGMVLTLYVFMADTLRVAGQGADAVRHVLPTHFNWELFAVALVLMSVPIFDLARRVRRRNDVPTSPGLGTQVAG